MPAAVSDAFGRDVASAPTAAEQLRERLESRTALVGIMGLGIRAMYLLERRLCDHPDIDIAYVCDVDAPRVDKAAKLVEDKTGRRPKTTGAVA